MNRIPQVDFFRGFFLIVITTNHFLAKQNVIFYFTSEYIGWITAAEGFVLLSGLTAGLVYSRKLVEKGEAFIAVAAKKRAWTIYKYHLILFFLVMLLLFLLPGVNNYWRDLVHEFRDAFKNPLVAILLICTFLYQPAFMDILPMYALFVLLLPFALKNFKRGNQVYLLAGSFGLYLLGTFNLFSAIGGQAKFLEPINLGLFNLLSWQFLFTIGLYIGYVTYQNKASRYLKNKKLVIGAITVCIVLFIFKRAYQEVPALWQLDLNYWVSKENLGPLRLLNFFSLLMVFSVLAARFPGWFSFKPICYLGRYSLEVFAFHILLVILLRPFKEYTNNFHAVQISDSLYFYPWATMLLFLLILALYLAPFLKNHIQLAKIRIKISS